MKYWFIVLIMIFNMNIFSQLAIDKSETVLISKNQFSASSKRGNFYKKFFISNTDNQPFITANIVLEGNFLEDIDVLIRYKTNEWSNWQNTKEDIHLREEGFIYKEMAYLPQGTQEFEVKANFKHKVEKLKIDFFYPEFTENLAHKTVKYNDNKSLQSINCACPIPAFEARLDWCPSGNCPTQTSPTYTTVTHLVVHHEGGGPSSNTSSDWAATVRSVWNYHVNGRGFWDIGYNYLIDPNGVIYEGRGNNVQGAHAGGANVGTMGICLLGDFEPTSGNGTPSAAAITSLEKLLSWKECDLSIDPLLSSYHASSSTTLLNITGHRDAGTTATSCPGDNLYDFLPSIRAACSSYMTNCSFPVDADLVVSAVSTNPSSVFLNQNFNIEYAIGNGGSASVTDSIKIDLEIDGVLIETNYLDSLTAGNIASFSLSNQLFDTVGNHSICVYISDAANETNTANNSYCKTVNVTEELYFSDISFSSFFVTNDNISITEEAEIIFRFQNTGELSTSEPVQVNIKVDNIIKQSITLPILAVNEFYSGKFTYNFSTIGQHEFCIEIESPANESNVSNNTDCESISIFPISKIADIENVKNLVVFPNPVKNILKIELILKEKERIRYSLKNTLGQLLFSIEKENASNYNENIDISSFSKGIYFLNIQIGNESFNKTIIIE